MYYIISRFIQYTHDTTRTLYVCSASTYLNSLDACHLRLFSTLLVHLKSGWRGGTAGNNWGIQQSTPLSTVLYSLCTLGKKECVGK